ncbi:proline/serine-rich coiled-coil protein 1 isoform X5 [Excalfactoria chinensis]
MMMEERGRAAVPNTGSPSVSSNARSGGPLCVPHASPPASPPDVQFITEEKFDFGVLSPSDSREDDDDDDDDKEPPGGTNGRWSPLSGAGLEEMVREATRLAAQLQQCHLSPLPTSPGGGSPRSPRRETFVVKDSPVRALLPTVPPAGVPKESPRCQPSPRGAPSSRGTPSPSGPPRPCPPRGAVARGRSEPLRAGTAAQPKPRSSTATPTRAPRARPTTTTTTTTTTSTVPRSRPPPPSAIPKPPGRAATSGTAPGGRGQPRPSTAAPRGAPLGVGAASRCRLGPPSSRLQPPRKTAASSAPR